MQLAHANLRACGTEDTHVVLHVPVGEGLPGILDPCEGTTSVTYLGEAIKPIGGGTHQSDLLHGNGVGHKLVDGVRDEEIGMLDAAPEVVPDFRLRRTLDVDEVTADLCTKQLVNRHPLGIWSRASRSIPRCENGR